LACDQKVAKYRLNSRSGNALLCPWARRLIPLLVLDPSSRPVVLDQPDKQWHSENTYAGEKVIAPPPTTAKSCKVKKSVEVSKAEHLLLLLQFSMIIEYVNGE